MSKSFSGLFHGTLGTTYINNDSSGESYSDRGIEIPNHIKSMLSKLRKKGDQISGVSGSFSIKDVSIMSKESGVEFAHITIGEKAYLIRGDRNNTEIPVKLQRLMKKHKGTLDFHSHPYNDDCMPSYFDRKVLETLSRRTGQVTSQIVTPNGRITTFDKHGTLSTSTVSNLIDESLKKALIDLWR